MTFNKNKIIFFLTILVLLVPIFVFAQIDTECKTTEGVCNPAGSESSWSVEAFTGRTIQYLLGLVGTVALVIFIWAGFIWMMAKGNSAQIQKAQHMMVWAVLGLVVIFSAYILVNFVLENLNF